MLLKDLWPFFRKDSFIEMFEIDLQPSTDILLNLVFAIKFDVDHVQGLNVVWMEDGSSGRHQRFEEFLLCPPDSIVSGSVSTANALAANSPAARISVMAFSIESINSYLLHAGEGKLERQLLTSSKAGSVQVPQVLSEESAGRSPGLCQPKNTLR